MSSPLSIRVALIGCAALAIAGCVVQPAVYEPPPPRADVVVVMDAPPPLPIYDQPPCPYEGYQWVPGYWGWRGAGYYWVPGVWVSPPRVGVLWTPGYWAFAPGGRYMFHAGYWGERVGYYGGINYGGGYVGTGFVGGRWEGNTYRYNSAVTNVVNVHNVYRETVINNVTVNNTRVSYSGGQGGARTELTPDERNAERMPHWQPTSTQMSHERDAAADPAMSASQNHGRPPVAPTTVAPMPRVNDDRPPPERMPAAQSQAPTNVRPVQPERSADRDDQRRDRANQKPKREQKREQKRDQKREQKRDDKRDDQDQRDRPQ